MAAGSSWCRGNDHYPYAAARRLSVSEVVCTRDLEKYRQVQGSRPSVRSRSRVHDLTGLSRTPLHDCEARLSMVLGFGRCRTCSSCPACSATVSMSGWPAGACTPGLPENGWSSAARMPMAALLLSVLGVFAGFERALIRERQLERHRPRRGPRRLHRPQTRPHPPARPNCCGSGPRPGNPRPPWPAGSASAGKPSTSTWHCHHRHRRMPPVFPTSVRTAIFELDRRRPGRSCNQPGSFRCSAGLVLPRHIVAQRTFGCDERNQ